MDSEPQLTITNIDIKAAGQDVIELGSIERLESRLSAEGMDDYVLRFNAVDPANRTWARLALEFGERSLDGVQVYLSFNYRIDIYLSTRELCLFLRRVLKKFKGRAKCPTIFGHLTTCFLWDDEDLVLEICLKPPSPTPVQANKDSPTARPDGDPHEGVMLTPLYKAVGEHPNQ